MKNRWFLLAGLSLIGLAVGVGKGAEDRLPAASTPAVPGAPGQPAPEDGAIRDLADRFVKAFNAADARAIAALFTPDARFVDAAGEVVEGREAIEREYTGLFRDNPGVKMAVEIGEIRMLGPLSAFEAGTTRVTAAENETPVVARYEAVEVKQDGQWLLANVREWPAERTAYEHLQELAWLVGDWVDESADAAEESKFHWAEDKQALIRDFSVRVRGRVVMTGTQRIAWDPRSGQIRSWETDSEGGHGESLWSRLGNQWVVKSMGVRQDGRTTTATHIITEEEREACRWRTVDRTIGSEVIPIVNEFVMVRPPPKAQTTK